jgi:hypothetical protein
LKHIENLLTSAKVKLGHDNMSVTKGTKMARMDKKGPKKENAGVREI